MFWLNEEASGRVHQPSVQFGHGYVVLSPMEEHLSLIRLSMYKPLQRYIN